jgi:hypothetical protein
MMDSYLRQADIFAGRKPILRWFHGILPEIEAGITLLVIGLSLATVFFKEQLVDRTTFIVVLLTIALLWLLNRNSRADKVDVRYREVLLTIRILLGFIGLSLLFFFYPALADTPLWLLFVPVFHLISKHYGIKSLVTAYVLAVFVILGAGINYNLFQDAFHGTLNVFKVGGQVLFLGYLTATIHYLEHVRQAHETVGTLYHAIGGLFAFSMLDTKQKSSDNENLPATERSMRAWQGILLRLGESCHADRVSLWNKALAGPELVRSACILSQKNFGIRQQKILSEHYRITTAATNRPSLSDPHAPQPDDFEHIHTALQTMIVQERAKTYAPNKNNNPIGIYKTLAVPIKGYGVLEIDIPDEHAWQLGDFKQHAVILASEIAPIAEAFRLRAAIEDESRYYEKYLQNPDLDAVLKDFVAEVAALGYELVTVSIIDHNQSIIETRHGYGVSDEWTRMAVHDLNSTDIQALTVKSSVPLIVDGDDHIDNMDSTMFQLFQQRDMIRAFAPITVAAGDPSLCIGTVEAGYRDRLTFKHSLIQSIPQLNAIIQKWFTRIHYAYVHNQAKQLGTIYGDIREAVSLYRNTAETQHQPDWFAGCAGKLLGADLALVLLLDRSGKRVLTLGHTGQAADLIDFDLNIDRNRYLQQAVVKKQCLFVRDALTDGSSTLDQHPSQTWNVSMFNAKRAIRSFAVLPLRSAGGNVFAVLWLSYRASTGFTAADRLRHETFADVIGSVLFGTSVWAQQERDHVLSQDLVSKSSRLHDTLLQTLFALNMESTAARLALQAGMSPKRHLDLIHEQLQVARRHTQFALGDMLVPVEEMADLPKAVVTHAELVQRTFQIRYAPDISGYRIRYRRHEPKVIQIIREAVHNAVRHSGCTQVSLRLMSSRSRIELEIHDDGRGFDMDAASTRGQGLRNIQRLACELGGSAQIHSAIGRGTRVAIVLMISAEKENA